MPSCAPRRRRGRGAPLGYTPAQAPTQEGRGRALDLLAVSSLNTCGLGPSRRGQARTHRGQPQVLQNGHVEGGRAPMEHAAALAALAWGGRHRLRPGGRGLVSPGCHAGPLQSPRRGLEHGRRKGAGHLHRAVDVDNDGLVGRSASGRPWPSAGSMLLVGKRDCDDAGGL